MKIYCAFIYLFINSGVRPQQRFTDCGGELVGTGEVQFFTAPGYPDPDIDPDSTYPDNAYCEWTYAGDDNTFFGVSIYTYKTRGVCFFDRYTNPHFCRYRQIVFHETLRIPI